MSKAKLYNQLNAYTNMIQNLKDLENSGHYEIIHSALNKAFEAGGTRTSGYFKENLKVIVGSMIDIIWAQAIEPPTAYTISSPMTSVDRTDRAKSIKISLSPSSKTVQKSRVSVSKSKTTSDTDLSKFRMSYSSLKRKKAEEKLFDSPIHSSLDLISDFCHLSGAATFAKEKRHTHDRSELSPGPGYYNTDPETQRIKSPRATIPKGGTRFNFAKEDTPGPLDYYPQRHYLSKY